MNPYKQLCERQQEEWNALPIHFAFGQKQFDDMMKSWGFDSDEDIDKIHSIGAGGYILKKDAEWVQQTKARHIAERKAAIEADKTGKGFIYFMFLYELDRNYYAYVGVDEGLEEALNALGYTWSDVSTNKRLHRGFEKASRKLLCQEGF